MSVEDSALERPEYERSQFLHVTGQEHDVDVSHNQNVSNRRVQRGWVLVSLRRQMNRVNTSLASPAQGAGVAIVAHDDRYAPLDAAAGTGIQQALKRRSLMRGENSNIHGSGRIVLRSMRRDGDHREPVEALMTASTVTIPETVRLPFS
jgi:hypothetical protein